MTEQIAPPRKMSPITVTRRTRLTRAQTTTAKRARHQAGTSRRGEHGKRIARQHRDGSSIIDWYNLNPKIILEAEGEDDNDDMQTEGRQTFERIDIFGHS